LIVLDGQEHNAMETAPQKLATAVMKFLLDTESKAN
jgi:hypothetical protein